MNGRTRAFLVSFEAMCEAVGAGPDLVYEVHLPSPSLVSSHSLDGLITFTISVITTIKKPTPNGTAK